MKKKNDDETSPAVPQSISGVLGVGLDGTDGQKRITRTEEMIIVGGSQDTHEKMQDTAIYFSEKIEATGKRLEELPVQQALDLLREAHDKAHRS